LTVVKNIRIKIALHGEEQKYIKAAASYLIGLVFCCLLSQAKSSEICHYAASLIYEV